MYKKLLVNFVRALLVEILNSDFWKWFLATTSLYLFNAIICKMSFIEINFHTSSLGSTIMFWEMLTGASGTLVKDTKKGNYIVIIALKTV